MKLSMEEIREFAGELENVEEYLQLAGLIAPFATKIVDAVQEFGPALRQLSDGIIDYGVQRKIKSFNMYVEAGLERNEALILLIHDGSPVMGLYSDYKSLMPSNKQSRSA